MRHIDDLDWNLWKVLHHLFETGSVSESARRLKKGQPAVSQSLARLRQIFGDELFVRVGSNLQPTPRALQLLQPVAGVAHFLRESLQSPEPFAPGRLQRTFRVLLSDYAQLVLLPRVLEVLAAEAPQVTLDVQFRSDDLAASMARVARGELELSVAPVVKGFSGVVQQKLWSDHNVCVMRRRHPALPRLTVRALCRYPHLQVSARGLTRDFVDDALDAHGLKRHVLARVPHFATAPHLVLSTDAIAVVPSRIAGAWARSSPVVFVEPPLPLPAFQMAQYFPALLKKDPAHVFLRRIFFEAAKLTPGE